MTHKITLIRGDGVGPELAEATRRCIEATGVKIDWDIMDAGANVMDKEGTPLPIKVLESIKKNKVALKAPITTPIGTGFRSVNVALRKELGLYSCLRPCKSYPGVRSKFDDIDIVVVRENTEDLYAGIEFDIDKSETKELISFLSEKTGKKIQPDSAISIKPISAKASERIARFAFDYAKKNGRKKVTAVAKANIMKFSDGLFYKECQKVAKEYPEIEYNEVLVDNMCIQMVQYPENYDVLVMPNLYGDIISDLGAGLVGGPGLAPGANISDEYAVFEATHGSAPQFAGQNKLNPTAMILSAVMMLNHIGETKAAKILENATAEVIAEGKNVTFDLKDNPTDPSAVGTSQMADAIIEKIKSNI